MAFLSEKLILILGRSASGKSTFTDYFLQEVEKNSMKDFVENSLIFRPLVQFTDRPIRDSEEKHGQTDYEFVDSSFFENQNPRLIESRSYDTYLGTDRSKLHTMHYGSGFSAEDYDARMSDVKSPFHKYYIVSNDVMSYDAYEKLFGKENILQVFLYVPYVELFTRMIYRIENGIEEPNYYEVFRRFGADFEKFAAYESVIKEKTGNNKLGISAPFKTIVDYEKNLVIINNQFHSHHDPACKDMQSPEVQIKESVYFLYNYILGQIRMNSEPTLL